MEELIAKIVEMCPYPEDPEPDSVCWADFGEAVCHELMKVGLIKRYDHRQCQSE